MSLRKDKGSKMNKNVLQEGEDWLKQRRGLFTGSEASVLINKGRGKDFTDTGMTYIYKKVAERMGSYEFEATSKAMQWGTDAEPFAIKLYEQITGEDVTEVGLIRSDKYDFIAGSPDGLLQELGGIIEVKSPYNPANHIRYGYDLSHVLKKHNHQMQQNMFCTGTDFCDFISYDERSNEPIFIHRIERDDKYIDKMIQRFCLADEIAQEIQERLEVGAEF